MARLSFGSSTRNCPSCGGSGKEWNASGILIGLGTFGGSILGNLMAGGDDDILSTTATCSNCGGSGQVLSSLRCEVED